MATSQRAGPDVNANGGKNVDRSSWQSEAFAMSARPETEYPLHGDPLPPSLNEEEPLTISPDDPKSNDDATHLNGSAQTRNAGRSKYILVTCIVVAIAIVCVVVILGTYYKAILYFISCLVNCNRTMETRKCSVKLIYGEMQHDSVLSIFSNRIANDFDLNI